MANNSYSEAAKKRALADQYREMLQHREERSRASLSKQQYSFFCPHYYGDRDCRIQTEFETFLRTSHELPSKCILQKLGWMFGAVIPETQKEMILYMADHIREYPYSVSWQRRSFRSESFAPYASRITNTLQNLGLEDALLPFPLSRILNRELPEDAQAYLDEYSWKTCGYHAWQVAYALDHRDSEAEDAVRRILTDGNNSGILTRELIRGILLSHRQEFYELLGKLLLAARLQEGLRQAICENADCGTAGGFRAILQVIAENNLIRFSSVKRAVGTWLGLLSEEVRDLDRVSDKSVRLILDCLESPDLREAYLASEDSVKIHIALWSYGYESIEQALRQVEQISVHGTHHQLLTAGYFVHNLDLPGAEHRIAKKVLKAHNDREDLLAVWLPCLLPHHIIYTCRNQTPDWKPWFESREELEEYTELLWKLYRGLSGKARVFSPCIFPWYEARLAKSDLAGLICTLAAMSREPASVDAACALVKECDSNTRSCYFDMLLQNPNTELQRKAVLDAIADKESMTRNSAAKIAKRLTLTKEEYLGLEDCLRFKNPGIRDTAETLLLNQKEEDLTESIRRLLESAKEEVRLGGLDLLVQLGKDPARQQITERFLPLLAEKSQRVPPSPKEALVLETLLPKAEETAEDTPLCTEADRYLPQKFDEDYVARCADLFARYFPESRLPGMIRKQNAGTSLLQKLRNIIPEKNPCPTSSEAWKDLLSLSKFIDEHKTDTYISLSGEETMIGNTHGLFLTNQSEIPAWELWSKWVQDHQITNGRVIRALVQFYAYRPGSEFASRCAPYIQTVFGAGFECGRKLAYAEQICAILKQLYRLPPQEEREMLGSAIAVWFLRCVPDKDVCFCVNSGSRRDATAEPIHLLTHDQLYLLFGELNCKKRESFAQVFPLAVASAERCISAIPDIPKPNEPAIRYRVRSGREMLCSYNLYGSDMVLVGTREYVLAAFLGIIPQPALYEFILRPDVIAESLSFLSNVVAAFRELGREIAVHGNEYAWKITERSNALRDLLGHEGKEPSDRETQLLHYVDSIYATVLPVVLNAELRRGDSPAKYSYAVGSVNRVYGVGHFAALLNAMGNDTLSRSYYLYNDAAPSRRDTLTHLLSVCVPDEQDDANSLRAALTGKQISRKRLIEAALYSPEWIPLVGEYLGIPSFESVCYYFMAHMNEQFDNKRKAMIARYTPLSEEELNLGAFDIDWFRTAYASISEQEFQLIYDAAKYISDGARHARARKYADACLGKLAVEETGQAVSEKRNKDLLMAYALIPLAGEDDLCRRYLFIQKFRKESRKFGAQRIASEGKAAEMALRNLSLNAGYSDPMRLTLRMETKLMDDNRGLMERKTVDGVELWLIINRDGKAELTISKDGKELKAVPAKLKKHETVLALNEWKKALTEQYRRTRLMLEEAMENRVEIPMSEIQALASHPVVFPMLQKLVLISGDVCGFPTPQGLEDFSGRLRELPPERLLTIAHPFDLYRNGQWRSYQASLFEQQIVQPFRQVFRELYIKTDDERNAFSSLRYAGNQIQPAKTVATLRSRRWVADYEDGLQKVYYKENIVARIYALADWFSPSDIEAPTLEYVCFCNRQTGEELKIDDIPDIIFSEVMRDVDLAVSVAHAGGVDPETSHSTVEMRAAILSFVLPLFRIGNVQIKDHHALIEGKLASYSVHLGSGVVHQVGGAMIPVLPVHSQHRGRIFLPFADEDPKTAEIISKVLLFAEDEKIKDPAILSEISR